MQFKAPNDLNNLPNSHPAYPLVQDLIDRLIVNFPEDRLPIPLKLDSHSSANWTPVPPQTGRLFQVKLDSRSAATLGMDAMYVRGGTSVNVWLCGQWCPSEVDTGWWPLPRASTLLNHQKKMGGGCAAGVLILRQGSRGGVGITGA